MGWLRNEGSFLGVVVNVTRLDDGEMVGDELVFDVIVEMLIQVLVIDLFDIVVHSVGKDGVRLLLFVAKLGFNDWMVALSSNVEWEWIGWAPATRSPGQ